MDATDYRTGKLGARCAGAEASPDFDDLMLLRQCDDAGRCPEPWSGPHEALDHLKDWSAANG